MVAEARLEQTDAGLVVRSEGWFVLGAREAAWGAREGLGTRLTLEGDTEFPGLGINLFVLAPGEPIGMYHWEVGQEDFLVLAGEALLLIEGEERPLRQWDFVHCPPHANHIIIGAGEGPSVVLAVGARGLAGERVGYPVDERALRHGAGAERETGDPAEAYARFPAREAARYQPGWLPER